MKGDGADKRRLSLTFCQDMDFLHFPSIVERDGITFTLGIWAVSRRPTPSSLTL